MRLQNMEEIIKTTLLEFDKSSFLIDLVKHTNGKLYVSIQQTVHLDKDNWERQTIKINPSILDDILSILYSYVKDLPTEKKNLKSYFSEDKKKEVIARYLKGVEIKDLSLQFNCSISIIEQIITNAGLEIVSNKLPKEKKRKKRGRK